MPQSGTGVSVEAVDPVFQAKMLEMLKQTGRPEMVVGWCTDDFCLFYLYPYGQLTFFLSIRSLSPWFWLLALRRRCKYSTELRAA
jgi:hypothetical protein